MKKSALTGKVLLTWHKQAQFRAAVDLVRIWDSCQIILQVSCTFILHAGEEFDESEKLSMSEVKCMIISQESHSIKQKVYVQQTNIPILNFAGDVEDFERVTTFLKLFE